MEQSRFFQAYYTIPGGFLRRQKTGVIYFEFKNFLRPEIAQQLLINNVNKSLLLNAVVEVSEKDIQGVKVYKIE